jgi:hypothetical protein
MRLRETHSLFLRSTYTRRLSSRLARASATAILMAAWSGCGSSGSAGGESANGSPTGTGSTSTAASTESTAGVQAGGSTGNTSPTNGSGATGGNNSATGGNGGNVTSTASSSGVRGNGSATGSSNSGAGAGSSSSTAVAPDAGTTTRPDAGSAAGVDAGGGGVPGSEGAGAAPGGVSYPYIFSVFDDSAPVSDLRIYTSNDALNFTLLYDTGFTGPTGFLRDPSIMKNTDGKFYVAFTTPPTLGCCGPESSFGIASSANLKDWTNVATVPCGVPGTKNTWAPEWFKDTDGSVYAIVNVDGKTYSYKAMDATMTTFAAPTWIGIGPGYIDTFILTIGSTYHAFTKNSATYVEHATATNLQGPWTFVGTNDWAGWGPHKEAPALILLPTGTWRFYTDAGSTGHEMYSDSADVFQTWTAPQTLPGVGDDISHGTVIKGN